MREKEKGKLRSGTRELRIYVCRDTKYTTTKKDIK